jgi:ketosteroid isomerase-like protein
VRISYILGSLLALSLPAAAAEPDQNLKQEIGKVASAYEQNFNKKDAAGITSLYTKNYLRVAAGGVVADNTKYYEDTFKAGLNHLEIKTTEIQPLSDDMAMSTGESRITGKSEKGDPIDVTVIWTALDVRENGQWKIRMLTSLPKPPPPPQLAAK